jgi:hypothetical protein
MKTRITYSISMVFISLISHSQNWGNVLNTAKDAAVTNSTTIIDAAKTNTTVGNVITQAQAVIGGSTAATAPSLTNDEVIKGLKEALTVGTNNSSGMVAKADGYLKNPKSVYSLARRS